jgi:hypothetical protein
MPTTLEHAAQQLGISPQTIKTWEQLGLLKPITTTRFGESLYDLNQLKQLHSELKTTSSTPPTPPAQTYMAPQPVTPAPVATAAATLPITPLASASSSLLGHYQTPLIISALVGAGIFTVAVVAVPYLQSGQGANLIGSSSQSEGHQIVQSQDQSFFSFLTNPISNLFSSTTNQAGDQNNSNQSFLSYLSNLVTNTITGSNDTNGTAGSTGADGLDGANGSNGGNSASPSWLDALTQSINNLTTNSPDSSSTQTPSTSGSTAPGSGSTTGSIGSGGLTVSGSTLSSTSNTFDLLNTGVSTLNIGGEATVNFGGGYASGSGVTISPTGTISTSGGLTVDGTTTLAGPTTVSGNLTVSGGTISGSGSTLAISPSNDTSFGGGYGSTGATISSSGDIKTNGSLTVDGAVNLTGAITFNSNATLGGDIAVNGGDLTTTSTSATLFNNNATTVSIGGAGKVELAGGYGGNGVTIENNGDIKTNGSLTTDGSATLAGDATINGGDLISAATTFNLLDSGVTTLNVGGAATTKFGGGYGSSGITFTPTGDVMVNGTILIDGVSTLTGDVTAAANVAVTGMETIGGGYGSSGTTLATNGDISTNGDVLVDGGDITSTVATFNLLNSGVSTVNLAGAADLNISGGYGSTGVTVTSAGNLQANGSLTIDTSATFGGGYGSTGTTIAANGDISTDGDLALAGGDITSSGALTLTPNAGTNLNIALSGAGDFVVNSNQLYVDTSAGNVGIGTNNPASFKLQIAGNLGPDADNTYDLGSTTLRWKTLHVGPGSVVVHNDATNTLKAILGFASNVAQLITDTSTPLQLSTGSNVGINISTGGNVGIGTTNPSTARLEVGSTNAFKVTDAGAVTSTSVDAGSGTITTTGAGNFGTSAIGSSGQLSVNGSGNLSTSGTIATTGSSSITSAGAFVGPTSSNTINGLVISSGSLSSIAGYSQTTGTFAFSGGGNFSVDSAAFDVTTAGALSGITTISTSSTINSQTISSTANFTGTMTIATSLSINSGTALTTTNQSGTGSIAMTTSPSFTTPTLGAASATSINGLSLTANGTGFSIAGGTISKTMTFNNSLTLAGTDGTTITFQGTDTYVGRATTDTLTNKTIAAGSNTISGLTNSNLSGSAGITNANLANSSLTVTAGTGLVTGGSVALGSSVTLDVSGGTCITANANDIAVTSGCITSLGTVTTGIWQGTAITDTYLSGISGSKVSGSITGNAGNITAYTINQDLGTGNSPTFSALILRSPLGVGGSLTVTGSGSGSITTYVLDILTSISNSGGTLTLGDNVSITGTSNLAGNVGIGTTSTRKALDINGELMLGNTNSFRWVRSDGVYTDANSMAIGSYSDDNMYINVTTLTENILIRQNDNGSYTNLMRLDNGTGDLVIKGSLTQSGSPDIAENIPVSDSSIEAADIVAVDPDNISNSSDPYDHFAAQKSTQTYQSSIIGVISTKPGIILNSDNTTLEGTRKSSDNERPMVIAGRTPVKVSAENGSITRGDYLTSSSTPGVAMKSTQPGPVIGKALEDYSGAGVGKVLVFVQVGFADPSNTLSNLSLDNEGNLIIPSLKSGKISIDPALSINNSVATAVSDIAKSLQQLDATMSAQIAQFNTSYSKILGLATQLKYLSDQESTSSATIASHAQELASNSAQLAQIKQDLEGLKLTSPDIMLSSTASATLANISVSDTTSTMKLNADEVTVSTSFKSLGETYLGATTIAGDLTVDGTFSITGGNTINALGTLNIQSSPLASLVSFFNGQVTIDQQGIILSSEKVAAPEVTTNKLTITTAPVATSSAAILKASVLGASIGKDSIKSGTSKVTIQTTAVSANSRIFVTPTSATDKPLAVTSLNPGQGFDVTITSSASSDIEFNWWIVDSN